MSLAGLKFHIEGHVQSPILSTSSAHISAQYSVSKVAFDEYILETLPNDNFEGNEALLTRTYVERRIERATHRAGKFD